MIGASGPLAFLNEWENKVCLVLRLVGRLGLTFFIARSGGSDAFRPPTAVSTFVFDEDDF